jgi:hypothetical protein
VHNIILPSQLVHSIIDYTDRMRKFCAQIRKALTKSS